MMEKTSKVYWESTHTSSRLRLPSRLNVGTKDILNLLQSHVQCGTRVLEIGCAPGKHLAYLARYKQAKVFGLDYSAPGITACCELFARLGLRGEFVCENFLAHSLLEGSFDLVYSLGVIEHFEDPAPVVKKHLLLAKPGGHVLITIPNYRGLYGRLQRHFDPENLQIHNLDIMDCPALANLAPPELSSEVRTYPRGRLSPWLINIAKRWPASLATLLNLTFNGMGLLQPFDVRPLCPYLVLQIERKSAASKTYV